MANNDVGLDFKKRFVLASSEGHLYLTLLPTEKCNFRCRYCYEDFALGKMSEDTVTGIKNLITKSMPKLKNLVIAWFGGEPTLNHKAVVEISTHIVELQKQYGFQYQAHMTTNGFLLDHAMMAELLALGVNDFQISLDGDQSGHDSTRLQLTGKGSFDTIWQNLLSYRDIDGDFNLIMRLHLTAQNTESMWRLCHLIKAHFAGDNRYSVSIEDIRNLGASVSADDVNKWVPGDLVERVSQIKTLMSDFIHPRMARIGPSNPAICYAAMPRQLMIRADGSIGKCTVMLKDQRNHLGKLNREGDYELDGEKMEIWTRGFVSLNKKDIGCPAAKLPALSNKAQKFNGEIDIVQVA